jgi:Fe2+ or Zn2+ uptake regulation protein
VSSAPQDASAPLRRNRSRQREAILHWVQESESHPTAADIHRALLPKSSALSLGTVYRNLEILVADGLVDEVPSAFGATRYDGNVSPHHHFNCDQCGQIFDVDLREPPGLRRRLEDEHGLRASRLRISFAGDCPACTEVRRSNSRLTQRINERTNRGGNEHG